MKKKIRSSSHPWLDAISTKKYVLFLLALSLCISLFFSLFKFNTAPPCINADEAAFGYNAYSLLKTGADEYGNTLPVRLKSFGDYKMPLYSYLSVPFVATFGLNEIGIRALNIVIALLFPLIVYLLIKELFKKDEIAVIGSLLISTSLGKGIIERHAHEALLASFLITLASLFFIKYLRYEKLQYGLYFILSLFLSLFTYQSSRLFAVFFFVFALIALFHKKKVSKSKSIFIAIFVFAMGIAAFTDIIYKPTRVENLFLFNDSGFKLKVLELRNEGGFYPFYNRFTIGVKDVFTNELTYFSPQFLAINGDSNPRFGFKGMSPMTPIEYLFIFIGIYYLFKNKERWRFFLLSLTLISPLAAAFAWNGESLTRTLFLLVPLLILSSYGMYYLVINAIAKRRTLYIWTIIFLQAIFLFYSWDFYLNHYSQRATIIRSWQCGYEELTDFVKKEYNNYDTFYITQKNGEPYIFLLYSLQYPPEKYQKKAELSPPDEYGFGQVEKFDKFQFSIPGSAFDDKNSVIIGYPDDFLFKNIDTKKIKKIIIGKEEIFWIYENK